MRRDYADTISSMCAAGKHGRCSGWMIIPNYAKSRKQQLDLSVKCRCPDCSHPDVSPRRHLDIKKDETP